MVDIINLDGKHHLVPSIPGLEVLVRFPDGEHKYRRSYFDIPNSTVWAFNPNNHIYQEHILSDDVGCGMAAFFIGNVDPKESANKIYDYLKSKNVLGRGNHFVDVCTPIEFSHDDFPEENVLVIHSDGKSFDNAIPEDVEDAIKKQANAESFRENLGYDLAEQLQTSCEMLGNWTHNSVEVNGQVIYRKGVVKVEAEKIHMLPANLGEKILFYTVDGEKMPPYDSIPHATGRSGPKGETKVSLETADEIRERVYVPKGISNYSLRTEHPSCYNNFDRVIETLGEGKYLIPVGETKILSYVGKV